MALQDNLVAYWKLDEASGTRVDATGRGNDLTDNNTVTQAVGKVGSAAQFTAANLERLSRADNADLRTGAQSWEIAFWANITTFTSQPILVSKGNQAGTVYEFEISLTGVGSKRPTLTIVGSDASVQSAVWGSDLAASTWYFIDAYLNLSTMLIGISVNNGAFVTQAITAATANTAAAFNFGAYSTPSHYHNGLIDEAGKWNGRVLTAAERTALYNGGLGQTYPFLTASPLSTGAAILGVPTLAQKHIVTAVGLATSNAALGSPALAQKHNVTATGLATSATALGVPVIGQAHALAAAPFATGSAQFGTPTITPIYVFSAPGLVTGAALFGLPVLGQSYPLVALNLATGAAVFGQPALFIPPFAPAPDARVVRVPAASRVTKVING